MITWTLRRNPLPKGPKYLYGTKYGFCSSDFPYGLGKYTPDGYLGPFGSVATQLRRSKRLAFPHRCQVL